MSEQKTQAELKINGFAEAAGGEYSAVRISGRGKIVGDVVCGGAFAVNGSGDVTGDVQSGSLNVNGSGHISGGVKTGALKVFGAADIGGKAACKDLSVSGTADFRQDVDAQTVKVSGSVRVKGGVGAERFESTGIFEVGGLLNAEQIDVRLHWSKSRAKEVGGEVVSVRRGSDFFNAIRQLFSINPCLEADTIEGTTLYLEHTQAKIVRGRTVTIGDGCDIGLVEYTGVLQKIGNARVRKEKQV